MVRMVSVAAALATAAGLTFGAAPASAVEVCDPNRFVCVYVVDDRNGCPGGYGQVARVPDPTGGVVLLVCALH